MTHLGDIFGETNRSEGPSGPNLRVRVSVPRAALGAEDGHPVEVERFHALGERRIERTLAPEDGDEGTTVRLRLPATFTSGSVLRIRGQGGRFTGEGPGRPGDLLLEVQVEEPSRTPLRVAAILLLATVAAALGAWFYSAAG